MYNPLNPLTPIALQRVAEEGFRYFVRQQYYRGKDHVIDDNHKAAFIFTHYQTLEEAEKHYAVIAKDKFRKIYDAAKEEDLQNLQTAATQPEGYRIYTSLFTFEKWKPPEHLLKKIRRYVYQNYEARAGEIKVLPFVEFGEIKVRFKQGTKETIELLSVIERI